MFEGNSLKEDLLHIYIIYMITRILGVFQFWLELYTEMFCTFHCNVSTAESEGSEVDGRRAQHLVQLVPLLVQLPFCSTTKPPATFGLPWWHHRKDAHVEPLALNQEHEICFRYIPLSVGLWQLRFYSDYGLQQRQLNYITAEKRFKSHFLLGRLPVIGVSNRDLMSVLCSDDLQTQESPNRMKH